MPVSAGTHLGPYEILGLLGAGGMGEVYKARDTHLKREVAIKVLPEVFAQDQERLARFQREAELLATLNHPHIAAAYGLESVDGLTGLVLELVEGDTLADLIARGFSAGRPTTILQTQYYAGFSTRGFDLRAYDVSPDGQRFLMIKDTAPADPKSTAPPASLVVVLNWVEELKRLVHAN